MDGGRQKRPGEDIFCQTIYDLIFKYTLHWSTNWSIGNTDYELKQTEIYCKIRNAIWILKRYQSNY